MLSANVWSQTGSENRISDHVLFYCISGELI